jgi:3-methylcrotonyl-CoA carboxylase beta subunit
MPDPSNKIISKIDATSARFEKNMRAMAERVSVIRNEEEQIRQGGGEKGIESQHAKKRLTARERIHLLIDPETEFFELGLYAAYEMYEEWGGAPSAGAVTGLGRIHGRLFMLVANDATVKAGAFFPMTAKKVIRSQNIAIENHIPTIYLVDSAGVFLPLQEDGDSADHGHHGHVRCRWRVPAGDVRHHPHDRRQRAFPGRTGAGAGGHRR